MESVISTERKLAVNIHVKFLFLFSIVCGIVHAAVFCTCSSSVISEIWKAVRTYSPWEVHTISLSCYVLVRCIRTPYGSVRMTYRLGNTHTISRAGCTVPTSGLPEARESPYGPIGVCSRSKKHVYGVHMAV